MSVSGESKLSVHDRLGNKLMNGFSTDPGLLVPSVREDEGIQDKRRVRCLTFVCVMPPRSVFTSLTVMHEEKLEASPLE